MYVATLDHIRGRPPRSNSVSSLGVLSIENCIYRGIWKVVSIASGQGLAPKAGPVGLQCAVILKKMDVVVK